MNAYYISIIESRHVDDIDIGIGWQAYWETYASDALIIARNRSEAWKLFTEGNEHMPTRITDIQGVSNKWYGVWAQFMEIARGVDMPAQSIPPFSHPLCELVQNHPDIDTIAQYDFGWQMDSPKWWKANREPDASNPQAVQG